MSLEISNLQSSLENLEGKREPLYIVLKLRSPELRCRMYSSRYGELNHLQ